MKKPILTREEYLNAVFSGKYDEKKINEIKKWKKQQKNKDTTTFSEHLEEMKRE